MVSHSAIDQNETTDRWSRMLTPENDETTDRWSRTLTPENDETLPARSALQGTTPADSQEGRERHDIDADACGSCSPCVRARWRDYCFALADGRMGKVSSAFWTKTKFLERSMPSASTRGRFASCSARLTRSRIDWGVSPGVNTVTPQLTVSETRRWLFSSAKKCALAISRRIRSAKP
jgi:hypothetical protein